VDDPTQMRAIATDHLRIVAARMNALGHYLESRGGRMPGRAELASLDRRDDDMHTRPLSGIEEVLDRPVLEMVGRADTPYTRFLYTQAQADYARHQAYQAWQASGAGGTPPEAPIMPAVYFEIMRDARRRGRA
jgi:hypothetical protein